MRLSSPGWYGDWTTRGARCSPAVDMHSAPVSRCAVCTRSTFDFRCDRTMQSNLSRQSLVERMVGGSGSGGARITPQGLQLLALAAVAAARARGGFGLSNPGRKLHGVASAGTSFERAPSGGSPSTCPCALTADADKLSDSRGFHSDSEVERSRLGPNHRHIGFVGLLQHAHQWHQPL